MESEDISPRRLEAGNQLIQSTPHKTCFVLREKVTSCKQSTILNKTGSSVTDLLLLAQNSAPHHGSFIVISDGGANNGINFNQVLNNVNNLIWIDIAPIHKNNSIILTQGSFLSTNIYSGLDIKHYYKTIDTKQNTIKQLISTTHQAIKETTNSYGINGLLVGIILCFLCILSVLHFGHCYIQLKEMR